MDELRQRVLGMFEQMKKETLDLHERSKTGRGCLLVTSFICMLMWQYRVVRPDTWAHLWKASSLALNLHSSSHCLPSSFQCTLFHPGWRACGVWCLWNYMAQRARTCRDVAANGLVLGGVGARHGLGG